MTDLPANRLTIISLQRRLIVQRQLKPVSNKLAVQVVLRSKYRVKRVC